MLPIEEGIVQPLFDQWLLDKQKEEGPKPTATGSLMRASSAGTCARQMAFQAVGHPADYELDASVLFTFDVGNVWHERIQGLLAANMGAELEVVGTLEPEYPISFHADATYDERVVEIKSVSGYAFGLATGRIFSEDGPGPKVEHVLQAGICGRGLGKSEAHMIYIDKDKNGLAEWVIDLNDLYWMTQIQDEIERMKGIAGRIAEQKWPKRVIPGYGPVASPPPYMAKRGEPWNCRYCRWRETCIKLPVEAVSWNAAAEIETRIKEIQQ